MNGCRLKLLAILGPALWAGMALAQTQPATATEPAGPTTSTTAATEPAATTSRPDEQAAWRKIWAYRAALAEAAVAATQSIKAQPLDRDSKVGDFLGESPQLEWALQAWLVGLPLNQPPGHGPDGACQLSLLLKPAELANALGRIRDRYYEGAAFKQTDFGTLAGAAARPLEVQGRAAAHPALVGPALIAKQSGREYFDRAAADVRSFWEKHVTAEGRATAENRACQDAFRRLGERIEEVHVDEATRLADYVAAAGAGEVDMGQFLRAARVQGLRYHPDAPIIEAEVSASLRTVYACLKAWTLAHMPGKDSRPLEELVVAAAGAALSQTGIGYPDRKQLKTSDPGALRALALAESAPDWLGRSLRQTGRAEAKPARDDTRTSVEDVFRHAEWHARTVLASRLEGLPVAKETLLGQLLGRDAQRRSGLLAVLLDARLTAVPMVGADGSTEVTLELPLMPLWRLVLCWQRQARPEP